MITIQKPNYMKKFFTLIFLLAFWAGSSWGQTVTIGSGTSTGYLIPVNSNYGYTYSQQIVLQSEIATAGQITKLRFYMVGGLSLSSSNNWTIYLGHTTKSSFSSSTDWVPFASLTQVFSGTIASTPPAGWYEITLTGTFNYNNTNNLVVAVDENASGYNLSTSYVRIWTTPVANRAIHYRSDGTNPDPASPPTATGRLAYINQMQLDIAGAPCTGTPTPGNTISSVGSVCSGVNFNLSLQNATTGTGVTYQWESSPDGLAPWTPVGTSVSSYTTSQSSSTYYHCIVTCSGNTGTSNPVQVTMNTWINCYCAPTYSSGGATDMVAQVTLGTLSQATVGNVSPYYYNYTTTQNAVPDLTQGFNSNLSLTFGSDANQYNGVWVDFDQDGTFETSEFFTSGTNAGSSGTVTVVIAVPGTATLGNTRLRIRGGDDTQPTSAQACGASASSYGQAQDYFVNIVAATSPFLTVDPTSLNFGTVPSGNTSAEMTYSLSGINLTAGPVAVTAPSNFEVSLTTGGPYSSSVNVNYTAPTLTATTIYAVFKPTTGSTAYSGNISNTGGGAPAANVAVSGASPCDIISTFPYNENFSSTLNPCWSISQVSLTGLWTMATSISYPDLVPVVTLNPQSGTHLAKFDSYNFTTGTVSRMKTSVFDFTTLSSPSVEFYMAQDAQYSSLDKVEVQASTNGGTSWTTISPAFYRFNASFTTPGWQKYTAYLPAFANTANVTLAFLATGAYGNMMAIDNVVVKEGLTNDVGTAGIWAPTKLPKGQDYRWWTTVKNYAPNTQTFAVETNLRVNGTPAVTVPNTITGLTFNSTSILSGSFSLSSYASGSSFDILNKTNLVSDQNTANDELINSTRACVNDTIYAWDDGVSEGAVGYNTGTGWLGQVYYLSVQDTLTSITIKWGTLPGALAGTSLEIYNMSGGIPTTKFGDIKTGISLATTDQNTSKTYKPAAPIILPAGTYWIGAHQSAAVSGTFLLSTDESGFTADNYVTGFAFYSTTATTWTDYSTSGLTSINMIRPNFGSVLTKWTGALSSAWENAGNWNNGVPTAITDAVIPAGLTNYPTITAPAYCNNITIASGASLIDNSFLTVSGTSTVKRDIPASQWHLISSPVLGATAGMFTGHFMQTHLEGLNSYSDILDINTPLTPVKGFALWGDAAGFTASYSGPLNTGSQSYSTAYSGVGKGWNLVGNPYPSAIDFALLTRTNVNNAFYVHISNSSWGVYGAGVTSPDVIVTQYIASGQGFFVQASAAGSLSMDNSVRVHNSIAFYKKPGIINNLIRMTVSGNGYTDEAVVRFVPEATAEFDGEYDAVKLYGDVDEAAQLYSGSSPLAINALPQADAVPVGIHVGASGIYTIAATEVNDFSAVSLEDIKTNTFTDLLKGSYTFSFAQGEPEQRFVLHLGPLSINEAENTIANIYSFSRTVYINLKDNVEGDIYIYTVSGQLVATIPSASGSKKISLANAGNYIVKVITNKNTIVKKVFVQ